MNTNSNPRNKAGIHLVSITTTALSGLHLHKGQFSYLRLRGFDVTAIAAPGNELQQLSERENVNVCAVSMAREIRPFRDLISLFQLWRVLRQLRPDIVNAGTPKAGFIGMLAAWLAGVPVRIYTQRGLRLETCRGFKARLLTWTERIACRCAHRVIFISNSLRSACLQRKLVRKEKAVVIGSGSSNGVDAVRFQKTLSSDQLDEMRAELDIPEDVPVIGFVGRLTRDKGIEELCEIFKRIRLTHQSARLLIVGDYEAGDPVSKETVQEFQLDPNVIVTGFVKDASIYYQLMSVLAFPSHREGFGNVVLEAACAGVPTVGFQATGTVDAIQDQQTGIVVPLRDTGAFATAIDEYLRNSELRRHHGEAARSRAVRDFAPQRIWEGLFELYQQLLETERSPRSKATPGDGMVASSQEENSKNRSPIPKPLKLVHLTTVPQTLYFLVSHFRELRNRGVDVDVIAAPGEHLNRLRDDEKVNIHGVRMKRQLTPWEDLITVIAMVRLFRKLRPVIVHAHTPKGGLLGMLAAWLAGVRVRVYHVHGLPLETSKGLKRILLICAEWLACRCANQVYGVSDSVRNVVVQKGLCPSARIRVLNHGSISGVDAIRTFVPEPPSGTSRQRIRDHWGIKRESLVIGFVGRLVRDKGFRELAEAWQLLRVEFDEVHLLIVGGFETDDLELHAAQNLLQQDNRVHFAGEVCNMPPLYSAMDVVAFPTYREGLGQVGLEAGAMQLPVVASRVTGCVDAIIDGTTGILVPPRDPEALAQALRSYLIDPALRQRHGAEGRVHVLAKFSPDDVLSALFNEYDRLLSRHGCSLPQAHLALSRAA
jgi:glycosyltransferase involved in cell wall biosynthesis